LAIIKAGRANPEKERIVNIVRTKSAALVVAAAMSAAPVVLATAGTAQAAPSPANQSNGAITVRYQEGEFGLGVNASIWDNNNPDGVVEVCHYESTGVGGALPFNGTAVLNGNGPGTVHIPGGPLGGQWNVNVHCDGTGESFNFSERY
jgi:hypothetical protein